MNTYTVSPKQARFLWYISWLSLGSGIFACMNNKYDLAPVPLAVYTTSLLYWQYPVYGWRRNLDIINSCICLWYNLYRSYGAEYATYYYSLTGFAIMCFGLGWIATLSGRAWIGVVCHAGVHVFANIGNIILYTGHIQPILY